MDEKVVSVKVVVKGLVQGIGYRWFVQNVAQQEKINGYVKNNDDGSVEIIAESNDKQRIEKFIQRIKTEHKYAVIRDVEVIYIAPKYYKNFRISF